MSNEAVLEAAVPELRHSSEAVWLLVLGTLEDFASVSEGSTV